MKSNNKLSNEEKDKEIAHIMANSFTEHEKINNKHADGSRVLTHVKLQGLQDNLCEKY